MLIVQRILFQLYSGREKVQCNTFDKNYIEMPDGMGQRLLIILVCIILNRFFCLFICLMVFSATFNNITDISCRSVLFVEETGGPGENYDLSQVTDKLYHIMLYSSPWSRFELTTSVVIGTDCIGSCKFIIYSKPPKFSTWHLGILCLSYK